jgi:hypothetical protein
LELLRSFADRISKHLPHDEANLHPGMKIFNTTPPLNTVPLALWKLLMC